MATKKETSSMKGESCMMCGGNSCGCMKWMMIVKAIIFLLFGYLLWTSMWPLEAVVSVLLILGGLKYLIWGFKCR